MNRPTLFRYLAQRLILFLLLGAAVWVGLGSSLWWWHVSSMAMEGAGDLCRLVAGTAQERVRLAQETLRLWVGELESLPRSQWQEAIGRWTRLQPLFSRVVVADLEGIVLASSDVHLQGWDFSRYGPVEKALAFGVAVSDIEVDPSIGAPTVEVGVRGHGIVVVAALDLRLLQQMVTAISSDFLAAVADPHGRIIAHPDAQTVRERQVDPWFAVFMRVGEWGVVPWQDKESVGVLARIQPMGWMVVVRLPQSKVWRPVVAGVGFFVGTGLVGVGLGVLVARRVARRLTESLESMNRQAAAVAAGEYDAKVRPQGLVELDVLAESMNHMAAQVRQRESDNAQLMLSLEDQLAHVQELAALNRSIFESVAEGIVALDALGRVTLANTAARAMLDDGTGVPLWATGGWQWPCVDGLLAGRPLRGMMVSPQGRSLEFSCVPLPQKGRVCGVVSLVDVTEREATIRAQEEARRQVEETNRMKDEFLANMSHELRTPLNGIMGVLQLLRLEGLPAAQAEQVGVALDCTRNLLRVLTDILELSRTAAGFAPRLTPVDVVAVAHQALALVRTQAQSNGVELRVESEESLWVEIEEVRIRQILMNLVGNAAKFTRQGEVVVRLDALVSTDGQERLLIQVEDTGIGMIPEHIDIAFERFRQEDASSTRKYQGAGLGLAVVKRLAVLLGGRITVDTAPGQGFWISVCLPARRVTAPTVVTAPTRGGGPPYGLRVLVVEDDDVNRFMARALLQKLGCHVEEAINGLEALQKLRAQTFDVVFLDIQMPEMDGLQTARVIRTYPEFVHLSSMPIIALTAHALPEDEVRAKAAGMQDFLTKPLDLEQLQAALERVLTALAL
jgi:signal transduction histidine kinase/CheY-like chemotaxis protein